MGRHPPASRPFARYYSSAGASVASGSTASSTGSAITAPSELRTSRGIGIGAARADVETTYAAYLGKGRQPDEPDTTSPTSLIIGSIYGGTFFTFEGGNVSEIFVGVGAE